MTWKSELSSLMMNENVDLKRIRFKLIHFQMCRDTNELHAILHNDYSRLIPFVIIEGKGQLIIILFWM